LRPKEAVLASQASAMMKFDLSHCRILKETVIVNPIVLYLRKNHFLVQSFNKKLSLFKSAGLIDFFVSKFAGRRSKTDQSRNLKILTLFELSGAFKVWLFGLAIAAMTFVIEIVSKLAKKRGNTRHSLSIIKLLTIKRKF
jgi:hypothetical protein